MLQPEISALNPQIRILAPAVAERIAAGEVVERPASVVKELVENALDAQARRITVSLEEGGKTLIEVLDNGHGMSAENLKLSVLRHATSKIREVSDLDELATLGFRGEALPSIAAVAELQILSRHLPGGCFELRLSQNNQPATILPTAFGHFHGDEQGTRVRVHGLFAQVPGRLKFMKSPRAEVALVREWLERLSLIRPDVHFELRSDQRSILNLKAKEETQRVQEILTDGQDFPLKSIIRSAENNALYGRQLIFRLHWVQGLSLPQSRKMIQVVNGRILKDRLLQSALMAGFKQILLPGQFPALVLYLDLHPSEIDCNVHPSKTEVRFLNAQGIFKALQKGIESLLSREGAPAFAQERLWQARQPEPDWPTSNGELVLASPASPSLAEDVFLPSLPSPSVQSEVEVPLWEWQFSGCLFSTFLVFELQRECFLLDQHAADERIRYEALKRSLLERHEKPASQYLLQAEVLRLPEESLPALREQIPQLQSWGFDLDLFSESSIIVRAVPSDWLAIGQGSLSLRLMNLVEKVIASGPDLSAEVLMDERIFEKLASQACRSSLMSGDRLEHSGLSAKTLLKRLFECQQPWNCPHGRPTVVKLSRQRIEEWFQRIPQHQQSPSSQA